MTKAPISLRDLRRRIYRKAKAEPAWRFWGLYVHVCKLETLREAYRLAKQSSAKGEWPHGGSNSRTKLLKQHYARRVLKLESEL
jgi:hypothetical protein